MQADTIKLMLKAPGTKRLKLEHANLLSNVAFNFNLRRCRMGDVILMEYSVAEAGEHDLPREIFAKYRLPVVVYGYDITSFLPHLFTHSMFTQYDKVRRSVTSKAKQNIDQSQARIKSFRTYGWSMLCFA